MRGFETYRKADSKVFNHTPILLDLKYLFSTITNIFYYSSCMASFQKASVQNTVVGFTLCSCFDLERDLLNLILTLAHSMLNSEP